MIHIYKVKAPGQPIKTYTSTRLHKERPDLFELARYLKPGQKKVKWIGRTKRKKGRPLGIHHLHPREMSPKARRKVCGAGLRGEARRRFIEEGMTLEEQMLEGRVAAAAETNAAVERWKAAHPEEYVVRNRKRKERTQQRRKKEGRIDYSKFYSPQHIAKASGLTAAEVRKFLRKKKIGKRGGRYAFKKHEAQRVARAAKRYYAEE